MKKLFEVITSKATREIIIKHTKKVLIDIYKKNITIYIDKNYALNKLISSKHIGIINEGIKNGFGEEYRVDIKYSNLINKFHDREMNVPHNIHYS